MQFNAPSLQIHKRLQLRHGENRGFVRVWKNRQRVKIVQALFPTYMFVKIHAEQLTRTGAARLGIELDAASADHLDKLSAADIRALARSNVVATLLPGANFHLGLKQYPPARKLIDAGAAVALATDFNPGTSPTLNMQFILSLACTQMRMTPAEAISASTINAAPVARMTALPRFTGRGHLDAWPGPWPRREPCCP